MDVTLAAITKRFDRGEVLTDIDLNLGGGAIVAVIGLNGAGKSTLLRLCAGVIAPTSGRITWDGCDSIRDDLAMHRQMIFLPDFPMLIEQQTVIQHLALHLRAYDRDRAVDDATVIALLDALDLLAHARARLATLSRGQRYKAALAALLLIRPALWLLDEPFASGMDPQGMQVLKEHARAAAAAGACIVYTTQIIEIAERFCDHLLVIDGGRIAQRFTQADLRAMPADGPGSLGDRLARFREQP